jgi:hypothetical protein
MMNAETREETAYATLKVVGDQLDPAAVTALLGLEPTFSVRKGEAFGGGRSGREYTGRTGVWNLSTKQSIQSSRLLDHLHALASLLTADPGRIDGLRDLVRVRGYRAGVSCFWHGTANTEEPSIPESFRDLVQRFGGEIDTDFGRDDEVASRTAAE